MAEPEVVPQETTDSADSKREVSTIAFPYMDLDEGIKIAKAIHHLHGSTCQPEQIAAHLKESPTSSSFRTRVASAKLFGLVTTSQGSVTLTRLGSQICDPQQEKAARAEAFLLVPLYKAVYDQFKGAVLPPTNGLEAAIGSLGVAPKQRERARQVLQRSAQEAGFFQFGSDRLVLPAVKANASPTPVQAADDDTEKKNKPKDEDEDELPPFIKGLLKKLPAPDSEWPVEARTKWLQAAVHIFDLMYTDSDDSKRSITIEAKKDSAK
ncbi:MAG: hypothetical protein ABSD70_01045 [Terracidiphilus sp.]|jgi:hypothetical protein